jgi:alpha-tubulin suppressor-like RCC1 family protein
MSKWLIKYYTSEKDTDNLSVAGFRDAKGGIHAGLSDNAGRLILRSRLETLADEVQVTAGNEEESALTRDVSWYRTYSYVVRNGSAAGTAQVTLRLNETFTLASATVGPGQTAVLTPDPTLPYPVLDGRIQVTYVATAGSPDLIIRFAGQIEDTLSGLPLAPFAWGNNFFGQLGDSSAVINRLGPVHTLRLAGVKSLIGGEDFSLALLADGTVWAWGGNGAGQLGNGTTSGRLLPNQITGLSGIVSITSGTQHSLALRSDGAVFGWGLNNQGQIGDGTSGNIRTGPVQVVGVGGEGFLCNIVGVAAGNNFSLALRSDGRVFAWGNNSIGQLGNNNAPAGSPVPVSVVGVGGAGLLQSITEVSSGAGHSLARRRDGTVLAWGNNGNGQLGNNNAPTSSPFPVQVRGVGGAGRLSGIKSVLASQFFSLALGSGGTVFAWGSNAQGQLGNNNPPTSQFVPVQVLGPGGEGLLTNIKSLAAGFNFCLALRSDGRVFAWGSNDSGQLGNNGTASQSNVPEPVTTISDVVSIGAGGFHSLAVVR